MRAAGVLPRVAPAILIAAAALILGGRLLWQARADVRAAEVAHARGYEAEAVRAYCDALRMYVPGSPFERAALDGLRAAAARAAAAGDPTGERRAWDTVRTGLGSTRSLYTPYLSRFDEADGRVRALDQAAFPPSDVRLVEIDHEAGHFGGRRPGRIAGTLLALGGFAVWVGSIVLMIVRGQARDSLDRRDRGRAPARGAGAVLLTLLLPVVFLAGFALFLYGSRFG